MFFNFKYHVKRKIKELLEKVVYESDSMTWKEELQAAKTIEIYTDLLEREVKI